MFQTCKIAARVSRRRRRHGSGAVGPVPSFVVNEAARKTNFLIILAADLGYGDVGCFGNRTIKTPNLDRLASQGIRLTSCYAAAPVCSPSRAGLLTGRTPSRVGVYDWIPAGHPMHLPRNEITVATLLQQAGYATCHVGKWHCNGEFNSPEQPQPGDHGFDHWFSTQNNAAPTHHNPVNFVRNGVPVGRLEGYSSHIVAGEAIHWLKDLRDPAKPFFLYVCFHEPHEPSIRLRSWWRSTRKRKRGVKRSTTPTCRIWTGRWDA